MIRQAENPLVRACRKVATRQRPSCRAGLTLVELIAAIVLSTMLLTITMGLATRISKHQSYLQGDYPYQPWKQRVNKLINADFGNCRSFVISEQHSTFNLITTHSIQSWPILPKQFPCSVSYYIESIDGRNYLIRNEQLLVDNVGQQSHRTTVCSGIRAIRCLTRLDSDYPPGALTLKLIETGGSVWLIHLTRHGGG